MFKIVAPTQPLLKFIKGFNLNLLESQMRHAIQFLDALLACEGTKTIAKLNKRGWYVICSLKHNRKFTKTGTNQARQLQKHARYTRNKDFKPMMVKSYDSSTRYWVNQQRGYLNDIADEVSIFISKRHPKDSSPEYFMTTDLSLSPAKDGTLGC